MTLYSARGPLFASSPVLAIFVNRDGEIAFSTRLMNDTSARDHKPKIQHITVTRQIALKSGSDKPIFVDEILPEYAEKFEESLKIGREGLEKQLATLESELDYATVSENRLSIFAQDPWCEDVFSKCLEVQLLLHPEERRHAHTGHHMILGALYLRWKKHITKSLKEMTPSSRQLLLAKAYINIAGREDYTPLRRLASEIRPSLHWKSLEAGPETLLRFIEETCLKEGGSYNRRPNNISYVCDRLTIEGSPSTRVAAKLLKQRASEYHGLFRCIYCLEIIEVWAQNCARSKVVFDLDTELFISPTESPDLPRVVETARKKKPGLKLRKQLPSQTSERLSLTESSSKLPSPGNASMVTQKELKVASRPQSQPTRKVSKESSKPPAPQISKKSAKESPIAKDPENTKLETATPMPRKEEVSVVQELNQAHTGAKTKEKCTAKPKQNPAPLTKAMKDSSAWNGSTTIANILQKPIASRNESDTGAMKLKREIGKEVSAGGTTKAFETIKQTHPVVDEPVNKLNPLANPEANPAKEDSSEETQEHIEDDNDSGWCVVKPKERKGNTAVSNTTKKGSKADPKAKTTKDEPQPSSKKSRKRSKKGSQKDAATDGSAKNPPVEAPKVPTMQNVEDFPPISGSSAFKKLESKKLAEKEQFKQNTVLTIVSQHGTPQKAKTPVNPDKALSPITKEQQTSPQSTKATHNPPLSLSKPEPRATKTDASIAPKKDIPTPPVKENLENEPKRPKTPPNVKAKGIGKKSMQEQNEPVSKVPEPQSAKRAVPNTIVLAMPTPQTKVKRKDIVLWSMDKKHDNEKGSATVALDEKEFPSLGTKKEQKPDNAERPSEEPADVPEERDPSLETYRNEQLRILKDDPSILEAVLAPAIDSRPNTVPPFSTSQSRSASAPPGVIHSNQIPMMDIYTSSEFSKTPNLSSYNGTDRSDALDGRPFERQLYDIQAYDGADSKSAESRRIQFGFETEDDDKSHASPRSEHLHQQGQDDAYYDVNEVGYVPGMVPYPFPQMQQYLGPPRPVMQALDLRTFQFECGCCRRPISHTESIICPGCGPNSYARFCSLRCLFSESNHWQLCRRMEFDRPITGIVLLPFLEPMHASKTSWRSYALWKQCLHLWQSPNVDYRIFFPANPDPRVDPRLFTPSNGERAYEVVVTNDTSRFLSLRQNAYEWQRPVDVSLFYRYIRDHLAAANVYLGQNVFESQIYEEFGMDPMELGGYWPITEEEWVHAGY